MKQTNSSFEVNHIDVYKDSIVDNTILSVQPSQKVAPRKFPPLTYSKNYFHFLKKILFS